MNTLKNNFKKLIIVLIGFGLFNYTLAQSVGIGSTQFTPSSTLEIRSTNNTAGTYGFKLLNSSSATMMFIQNDGNVGIGSATPGAKLDIVGTINNGIRYIKTGAADARITLGDPTKSWSAAVGWATGGDFSIIEEGVSGNSFYIKQGGNVGLNTSNPADKLHVYTTTSSTGIRIDGTTAPRLSFANSGTTRYVEGLATAGAQYSTDAATNDMVLRVEATTQKMLFNTNGGAGASTMALINGNVGIGTSAPGTKLTISNNTTAVTPWSSTLLHIIGNDAGTTGPILIDGFNGGGIFRARLALGTAGSPTALVPGNVMAMLAGRGYLGTAGYSGDLGHVNVIAEENFTNTSAKTGISFDVTPAGSITYGEKMRLNGDGNLGIGSAAPVVKLDISDNATAIAAPPGGLIHAVSSNTGNSVMLIDGIGNSAWYRGRLTQGTAAVPAPAGLYNYLCALGGSGYLGTAGYSNDVGRVVIHAEETFTNTSAKTGILFEVTAAGSIAATHKMRLTGDGYLAVGTAIPINRLEVAGGAVIGTTYSGVNTAPTNGLLVQGNVSIGTTLNGAKLHVFESNGANAVSAPIVMSRYWASATDTRAAAIFNYHNGTNTNDQLVFAVSGDGGSNNSPVSYTYAKMVIQANGNVGIGATEPIAKFVVNSGRTRLFANAEVFALGLGRTETGAAYFLGITNHATQPDLVFNNNGGQEKVRIQYDGRVGIGTTVPTAGLHVAGDGAAIYAGFNYLQTARFKTNANGSIILDGGQTAGTSYLRGISWGFNSEDFGLTRFRIDQGVAPITDFYISTAGNVHVGGAAPGSKFDVGANGDGTVARANAWNTFSDARWKKDVTPITNGLSLVQSLQGVNYTWKANDKKDFGFIAQEVEKVLPLAVHTDDKGYKSVDYARITSVLVEAVKEQQFKIINQQKIIDELKSTNQTLKTENAQQENRLQKLEQFFSEIKGNTIQTKK